MGEQADDDPRPGGAPDPGGSLPELLAGFEHGGVWDAAAPSAALAVALETAAGPDGLYEGAGPGAMVGITRQWTAMESWSAAGTLGSVRAMMREDSTGRPLLRRRQDLPDGWDDNLNYEIAAALAMGPVSAGNLARLAWTLGSRLPGIGRLLGDGTLTKAKAKLIAQTFEPLTEGEAARAEALILGELQGKTWYQVQRLAWRAALAVAPDLAARRRADAEKRRARVTIFREESGAVALSGRDLPAAGALSGHANVLARTRQYEKSGAFPQHSPGTLQALAYVHLLSGVSTQDAIAFARTGDAQPPGPARPGGAGDDEDDEDPWADDPQGEEPWGAGLPGAGPDGDGPRDRNPGDDPWDDDPWDDGSWDDDPDRGDPAAEPSTGDDDDHRNGGDDGPDASGGPDSGGGNSPGDDDGHRNGGDDDDPGGGDAPDHSGDAGRGSGTGDDAPGPDGGGSSNGSDGDNGPGQADAPPALPEVTAPLLTLQRRAQRAGENRLLGPLDPALTRDLADAAARSPRTQWEITIVDERGYAIGHGTARPGRRRRQAPQPPPGPVLFALPARVNITITKTLLHQLAAQAAQPRSGAPPGDWELAPRSDKPGDDAWTLTLPGGRELTVRFDVVPTHDCDHRYQVNTYEPGNRLRRLVQVRDYECTFPPCSRPARESDFEHAIPYDKGGRTDACNAGARSRRCHQVKQSKGWTVTQPKPGWHVWTTPTGRTYVQEPWRYIA